MFILQPGVELEVEFLMAELLGQMMSEGPEPKTTNKHCHFLHLDFFTVILVSSSWFFNNIVKLLSIYSQLLKLAKCQTVKIINCFGVN